MSYIPRSSFMPTTPGAVPKIVRRKHTFRVFGFIATILIVGAVLGAVSIYFYKAYRTGQLADAREELTTLSEVNAATISDDINQLEVFDFKIRSAQELLKNHLAPSKIFVALEKLTKEKVQLVSFEYTYDPGFQALLEVSGNTKELMSVAQQNIELANSVLFTEYVLSDIGVGVTADNNDGAATNNLVTTFTVKGSLEKDVFAYDAPQPNAQEFVQPQATTTVPLPTTDTTTTATSSTPVVPSDASASPQGADTTQSDETNPPIGEVAQ